MMTRPMVLQAATVLVAGLMAARAVGAAAHPPATTLLFIGNEAAEILSGL